MKCRCREVMIPKFIFYKNHQFRVNEFNKLRCIFPGVQRQVGNVVGKGIIARHSKAGRREEADDNLMVLIPLLQGLNHRFPLLKFTSRRTMHPDHPVGLQNFCSQVIKNPLPACYPRCRLFVPKRCKPDSQVIKADEYVVKKEQTACLGGKSKLHHPIDISLFLPA